MDINHGSSTIYVGALVISGIIGVTGQQEETPELSSSTVYSTVIISTCLVLALAILVINCAQKDKKKDKNQGTLEAGENDPYVDPVEWTGIMGQKHSSKSKRSSANSERPNSNGNQNHSTVQINQTYDDSVNVSKQQIPVELHQPPQANSVKDQKMDQLPHKEVDNKNGWKTFVPTPDGSYAPSETSSSPRSSIAKSVEEEDQQPKRLSKVPESPVVKRRAPVPNGHEANQKALAPTLPPKAHRISELQNARLSTASAQSVESRTSSIKSKASEASSARSSTYETNNNKSAAELSQDKILADLGLYRYKIAGDGNCLFRAVASQLRLPQGRFHILLRKAAAMWMREHKDELMDQGLLENDDELSATETEGQWPGHAAIVAMANLLKVNIAVIQGGERGEIDIEHIEPAEGQVDDGDEHGSLILSYMFNGHYDAVVDTPNMANPEYTAWCQRRGEEDFASVTLARKLQAEEDAKARRRTDAEYDDFRLARALMEEEKEAQRERQRPAATNHPKVALMAHRASVHMGENTQIGEDNISNASSEYERLTDVSTPMKSEGADPKHPVFGRQRSLSLTPRATGTSIKMQLSPQKGLKRNRSQSLSESNPKAIQDYSEDDIKKFLKPLSTMAAKKKFAYLDII